ncbi:acyltransferase family protein [Pelagicoccus albus]|uniref:Acyltransferase family protein n=1 Tax=Pelagicoccus albus TaxID=415222 RepID=A0A7X1B2Z3_9BACT|nr:acyltransferase [Pelagicoccus albus]MBC2604434.1 acyltransferase family protein [Pelagicoccus albus]
MIKQRYLWIDALKGWSIVLVVILHVSGWYEERYSFGDTVWLDISLFLFPFRMPAFFLVSGILASRSFGMSGCRPLRVSLSLYTTYLLWTFVVYAKDVFILGVSSFSFYDIADWLFIPGFYWYFMALSLYYLFGFLLVRFVFRFKPAIPFVLIATLVLSWYSSWIGELWGGLATGRGGALHPEDTLRSFFWFLIGIVFREHLLNLFRSVPKSGSFLVVLAVVGFLAGGSLQYYGDVGRVILSPLLMIFTSIILFVRFEQSAFVRVFSMLGKLTLSVYLLHWFFLGLLRLGLMQMDISGLHWFIGFVFPLVATPLAIAFSVVSSELMHKMKLGWMLEGMPRIARLRWKDIS